MSQPPWETQVGKPKDQPGWAAPQQPQPPQQQQPGGWNQGPYGQQPPQGQAPAPSPYAQPPQPQAPYGQPQYGQPPAPAPVWPAPPSQQGWQGPPGYPGQQPPPLYPQGPQGPQDPHNPMTVIPPPPQFSQTPYGQPGFGGFEPPPSGRKGAGRRIAVIASVITVLAVAAGAAAIALTHKGGASSNSQAGGVVSTPTGATSSFPDNTYASSTAGRSSDGSTAAAAVDPMDSAATDQTPFTAAGLVRVSFTDTKNVAYSLKAAGPHPCAKAGDPKVAAIIASSKCTDFLAASWVDKSGRIVVSAMIIPYESADAAKGIETKLGAAASTGDYAQWCPPAGEAGSTTCDKLTTAASREGKFGAFHRYLVVTTAVYTDLRHQDSQKDWLAAAADGAFQATLPTAADS